MNFGVDEKASKISNDEHITHVETLVMEDRKLIKNEMIFT